MVEDFLYCAVCWVRFWLLDDKTIISFGKQDPRQTRSARLGDGRGDVECVGFDFGFSPRRQ